MKVNLSELSDWNSFVQARDNELLGYHSLQENAEPLLQLLKIVGAFDASLMDISTHLEKCGILPPVIFEGDRLLSLTDILKLTDYNWEKHGSCLQELILAKAQKFIPPQNIAVDLRRLTKKAESMVQLETLRDHIATFLTGQVWDLKLFYTQNSPSMSEDLNLTMKNPFRRILFRDYLEVSRSEEVFDFVTLVDEYQSLLNSDERVTLAQEIWSLFLQPAVIDIDHTELQAIKKNLKSANVDLFRSLLNDQRDRLSNSHFDFKSSSIDLPFESKSVLKKELLQPDSSSFNPTYHTLRIWTNTLTQLHSGIKKATRHLEEAVRALSHSSQINASTNFVALVTEQWSTFLPTFHRYKQWVSGLDQKQKAEFIAQYIRTKTREGSLDSGSAIKKRPSDGFFKIRTFSSREVSPTTQRRIKSNKSPKLALKEASVIDLGASTSKSTTLHLLLAHFCDGQLKHSDLIAGIVALPHFYSLTEILDGFYELLAKITTVSVGVEEIIGATKVTKQLITSFYMEFDQKHLATTNKIIQAIMKIDPGVAAHLENLISTQKSIEGCKALLKESVNSESPKKIETLLLYPIKQLAQQLCVIDQAHFTNIPFREFHHINWTKAGGSPVLQNIATYADNLVYKFAHEIKTAYDELPKKGAQMLENLLDLGAMLLEYQNFNSLMLINLVLNLTQLRPVLKTASLSKKHSSQMESITHVFHTSKNFLQYRSALALCDGPFIECREVVLQDLLYLTESCLDFDKEMINSSKLLAMGDTILRCKPNFHESFPPCLPIAEDLEALFMTPPAYYSGLLDGVPGLPGITRKRRTQSLPGQKDPGSHIIESRSLPGKIF